MNMQLRPMLSNDWPAVSAIYLAGIATGNATFQTVAPSWPAWDQSHSADARLVALVDGEIQGWVALAPISARPVYRSVAEVSVYVASGARAQGIGKRLLEAMVKLSEELGYWTLQAGVFAENQASLALHRRAGFREVGYRERMGQLNGVWRNVVLLERRSQRVHD